MRTKTLPERAVVVAQPDLADEVVDACKVLLVQVIIVAHVREGQEWGHKVGEGNIADAGGCVDAGQGQHLHKTLLSALSYINKICNICDW